jgi:hypothetical protein
MRHGATGRRSRNRGGSGNHQNHGRGGGGHGRTSVFDSNGPDVRIRGTAHQICEKYLTLAKDAASMGNRVVAESYLQHAEHYQRLINGWQDSVSDRERDTHDHRHEQDRFHVQQPASQGAAVREDLGLPASIIGAPAVEKAEGTAQVALENA